MDIRPRPRTSAQVSKDVVPDARVPADCALDIAGDCDAKVIRDTEVRKRDVLITWRVFGLLFLAGFSFSFWILPLLENNIQETTIAVDSDTPHPFPTLSESHDGIVYRVDPSPTKPSNLPKSPVVDMVTNPFREQAVPMLKHGAALHE